MPLPFSPPADGWFQVTPLGTFPHPSGRKQTIDSAAVDAMVNRFQEAAAQPNFPGLLVDFDHFSHDPNQPSAAAGWITQLQARPTGLWAQIRFSDLGQAALNGGRYRSLSPVWNLGDCQPVGAPEEQTLRPLRLDRVALTNDPNLPGMVPLTNRAAARVAQSRRTIETKPARIAQTRLPFFSPKTTPVARTRRAKELTNQP